MSQPLPLFDYQAQGADLMHNRERFGLHDEMGVGKTATTIGAMDRAQAVRGIIVCPAMLRENWIKELRKFSTYHRRVCKGRNVHDFIAWQRGRFDILVTSYEMMTKWMPAFQKSGEFLDFLVFDEAHMLKNPYSARTTALLGARTGYGGLVNWAARAWHVTGTPMADNVMDIYAFLGFSRCIDMSQEQFAKKFLKSSVGAFSTKYSVAEGAIEPIRGLIYNNSIRRTHEQVGMQLPPVHLTEMLIEGKDIDLRKALEEYPEIEDQIVMALETGDMSHLNAEYVAMVRRMCGKAKALPYAELLKRELDAGAGKRVVFCWHTEPLLHIKHYLERYGYKAVTAYGDTPEHARVSAVEDFQNDPSTKVFIGNIKVAGTGLTLTAAADIDMLESDWSPAGNAQALKRVHRYGQTNTVRGRFITLANSIDVSVNKIVQKKTADIAAVEGHEMTAAPNAA